MRFTYKLRKILSGDAYASARRHVKQWVIGRAPLRFDAAKITQTIDREKFQQIYDRYAMHDPGDEWPKYLEIQRWMEINLKRVRDLGLDLGGRKRVLDIGCGTGYFLYICQYLGHDGVTAGRGGLCAALRPGTGVRAPLLVAEADPADPDDAGLGAELLARGRDRVVA